MMQPLDDHPGPFSIDHTFVLKVRAGEPVAAGQLIGRVEHVVSGQIADVASVEELVAFIARTLHQGRERND